MRATKSNVCKDPVGLDAQEVLSIVVHVIFLSQGGSSMVVHLYSQLGAEEVSKTDWTIIRRYINSNCTEEIKMDKITQKYSLERLMPSLVPITVDMGTNRLHWVYFSKDRETGTILYNF